MLSTLHSPTIPDYSEKSQSLSSESLNLSIKSLKKLNL